LKENKFDLKTIQELEKHHFVVEKYQRGYKWDIRQVEDLLNDIEEFDPSENGFYCLQPIVVKELTKTSFELLDGQQRSTTVFIILNILKEVGVLKLSEPLFTISYKTRIASETFLENINKIHSLTTEIKELNLKTINALWESYIEDYKENDNVDNYHFFMAHCVINYWVKQRDESRLVEFKDKLLFNTKVIWYNILNNATSEEVFINFNQGKIDLAQAELIKALFVLQLKNETNNELQVLKISQFAQEWNTIENKLQDNSFWYFVSNDNSDKDKANRIDLLFNIVKDKPKKSKDKLFAYRKYLEGFVNESKLPTNTEDPLEWFEVKNIFDILLEWYENRSLYHLIGYIIYERLNDIKSIIKQYNKAISKLGFKEELSLLIKGKYLDENKYKLENLSYETPKQTHSILLLFNLISYEKNDFSYRFPFHLFKTTSWSLEHIHAQNSEKFENIKQVKDWVTDLKNLKQNFIKQKEHKKINIDFTTIDICLELLNDNDSISRELKEIMDSLETTTNNIFNKHNLENICLLDGATNSSFNNDNFTSKREKLLKIDAGNYVNEKSERVKAFIPLATKNIFLKYYTQDASAFQMSYWGFEDRKQYIEYIKKTFTSFFNLKSEKDGE
jgi:uncharacterized protein with ParB-like and HNH nuclease domain